MTRVSQSLECQVEIPIANYQTADDEVSTYILLKVDKDEVAGGVVVSWLCSY